MCSVEITTPAPQKRKSMTSKTTRSNRIEDSQQRKSTAHKGDEFLHLDPSLKVSSRQSCPPGPHAAHILAVMELERVWSGLRVSLAATRIPVSSCPVLHDLRDALIDGGYRQLLMQSGLQINKSKDSSGWHKTCRRRRREALFIKTTVIAAHETHAPYSCSWKSR